MSEQDDSTTTEAPADAPTAVEEVTTSDAANDGEAEQTTAKRKPAKKAATTRTRTRTRTTTASADGEAKDESSSSAKDAKATEPEAEAADSDGDDDDDSSSRRRRRGSRGGRGRTRSDDGAKDDAADADDDADDTNADEEKSSSAKSKSGSSKSGSSKSGSKSGSSKGGKKKGGSKSGGSKASKGDGDEDGASADDAADDGKSKADRETEAAIAKGGTRMAAKRRGRSGGGASSGGGGGRSGGGGRDRRGGPRGVSEETRRAILDGPPRTMLVTHTTDRTQIVVMEDRRAVEHYVTHAGDVTYVGNIYMARVQNVLPGMEAAFLDIGKGRNGVLYAGEVLYDEQDLEEEVPRIENILKPGQKVLVQVTKDPMGTKGPRLTQHLSLAGRYCVLAPNSDLFGISRKLTDKERDRLRKIIKKVKPEQHGIIVRTAAENATDEALTADLERLLAKWEKVEAAAKDAKPMTAVYEEPKLVVKVIRDNFGPEFERCIVDDKDLFAEVKDYLEQVAPELVDKLELYEPTTEGEHDKPETLFGAYNVAEQLRKATERKVWLPSGGYLIIETTEAMKVVDVNTGKFTGSKDTSLEEVVLKTNLEAADEIVRQLRLRDMGGIIIIDFIDMLLKANQDQVIRRLKRELLRDRTKTRVSEVSRLGLVQMTRKNVSQGLVESFSTKCEHCNGLGRVLELPD